jgi:hypothetical protein
MLELRNRLERRRLERDQLKAKLDSEATSSMKTLRNLREDCDRLDKDSLSRAKKKYEDQASKTVDYPKCICAECAVEHKDHQISSLRRNYQALQAMQRVVADVQWKRESRRRAAPP